MEPQQILIKKARIIDPTSPYNQKVMDILIKDDEILSIKENIETEGTLVFEAEDLHVSPGWFDLRANFCDPGNEDKEDIESGINAALYGGFTSVAITPDTNPVIDSKTQVEYVYKKAEGLPVNVYPYGSFSKHLMDEELSEMHDMYQAGAIAFSQGKTGVQNLALIKLALQYQKGFAPPLHLLATDGSLAKGGQMHEGEKSTYLGLKGIPVLAEEIAIQNIFQLAEYAETPVHLMSISSASGSNMLKEAQKNGRAFTADVAVGNLFFTDDDLETYDTRLKAMPPFRSSEDRQALIDALKNDVIHAIASDHYPETIENKKCEFDNASFGIISLESFIGAVGKILGDELGWEKIIELISINPRRILGMEIPSIKEGNWAELTFFNPNKEWKIQKGDLQSKSRNSPFIGKDLKGKALGIYNEGTLVWLDN